ncbi:MAG TPA: PAS domain S-box protein [Patescibacteria group bacterium]|nr:PAS domain S-box protein [Patescibacteria group bacterium]
MYRKSLQHIINSYKEILPQDDTFKKFLSEVNNIVSENELSDYDPIYNPGDAILIIENSTDIIAVHEPDLTCTYVSPACKTILGYSSEEFRGMSAYDYIHPDDIAAVGQAHEELLKSDDLKIVTPYRLRKKNGDYVWVEATAKVIRDEISGDIIKIIAIVRDISKRKDFENQLMQGNIRLELLNAIMEMRAANKPAEVIIRYVLESLKEYFPGLRISYTTLDERTGMQSLDFFINFPPEAEKMLGRKIDLNVVPGILTAFKKNVPLIIEDAYNDERLANVLEDFKTRGTRSVAYFPTRYDNYLIGILSIGSQELKSLTPFEISAFNEVSRQLATTLREIRLANEKNNAVQSLSKRERELRTLLENTPDLIVRCDRELRYSYINKAIEGLTSIPIHRIIGRTNEELGMAPGIAHLWNKRAKRVFRTGQEESVEFEADTIHGKRFYQVNIIPEHDGSGFIENLLFIVRDITDRKNAENFLRYSEERFRAFMDNIPHMAFIKDAQGRYVYINKSLEKAFNDDGDSILLKTDFEWLSKEDAVLLSQSDELVLKTGIAREFLHSLGKSGKRQYYLTHKFPLKDHKGELFVGGMAVDVTQQKEAEMRIRHSEEMLRNIFENSATGMWITDIHWQTLDSNRMMETMLGYTGEELMHVALPDILHPDDQENFLQQLEALDSGITEQRDQRLIRKNGEIIWGNLITSLVRDSKGNVQFAITMISDITERVVAEETIRENEERFRAIFETAGIGIVLVSISGYILKTNPSFENILGYSGEELSFMHITDFTHNDDIHTSQKLFATLVEGDTNYFRFEKRYIRKNGDIIWGRVAASIVRSASGKPMYVVATVEDITQQRIYTENLQNLTEELSRKNLELEVAKENAEIANKAKSTFLSSMSHELRTPLNAILGFAQILKKDGSIPQRQQGYIETMYKSGNHLLDMINDVLDISKIESGRMELFFDDVDLHALLSDLHNMFNLPARQKNLQLSVSHSALFPQIVYTDAKRLRQVLINLLSNAIKFTTSGHISVYADVRPNKDMLSGNTRVYFSVKDTGRGIPAEEHENIFEPFRQTSGTFSEGSGLGLAISRKIAQLMNGTISVESVPGEGSTFTFEVEMKVLQYSDNNVKKDINPVIGIVNRPHVRVLIVDDLETNRSIARNILEPLGFLCREASDGGSALDIVKEFRPDIIMMDIFMPLLDGRNTARLIRKMPEAKNTCIIAVTAGNEAAHNNSQDSEFNSFLQKPFQEKELLDIIASHIGINYIFKNDEIPHNSGGEVSLEEVSKAILSLPEKFSSALADAVEVQDITMIEEILSSVSFEPSPQLNPLKNLQHAARVSDFKTLTQIAEFLFNYRS